MASHGPSREPWAKGTFYIGIRNKTDEDVREVAQELDLFERCHRVGVAWAERR